MLSKWAELKSEAIALRRGGASLGDVNKNLNIPKSTLSGWFKTIPITEQQKQQLAKQRYHSLTLARINAAIWHKQQKKNRLEIAKKQAIQILSKLNTDDKTIIEIALSMLYLGEGFKGNYCGLGSSNPLILKFFISSIKSIYNFDIKNVKCELHLRADQNIIKIKKYWSEELNVPLANFTTVSFDKRTTGRTTYTDYMGVCAVRCGNIAIQRRLLYLSQIFSEAIAKR